MNNLSKIERLTLCNQYMILKALHPDDAEYYEQAFDVLRRGYTYYYDELFNEIDDELPEAISEEVISILSMYRAINFSFDSLSPSDKETIPETRIRFEGFDGNEEIAHYAFAKFVLKDRYDELQSTRGYNTHRNVLPKYRRMLAAWKEMNNETNLDKDQILKLIDPKHI